MIQLSRFAAAAKSLSLGEPISYDNKWLGEGRHAVTIEDSNADAAEATGKLGLVLKGEDGKTHSDNIYIMDFDGKGFSWEMRAILGAALPSADAQAWFLELIARADSVRRVLECFRGMRLLVELKDGPGFKLERDPATSEYVARVGGVELARGSEHKEVVVAAKASGHPRSFRKIKKFEVIDDDSKESNLAAFSAVVESIQKTTGAGGDPEDVQFDGVEESATGT